jgi:class 3 adenylate cyclase
VQRLATVGAPTDDGFSTGHGGRESAASGNVAPHLAAFRFADILGYTRFTERQGAERASTLAAALVSLAGEIAAAHRGLLRGSWGDQVLLEFDSPADAVRAAGDLQRRCVDATVGNPSLPLHVGVGLDIGDAVVTGDNVSAAGLNVAARLWRAPVRCWRRPS